MAGNSRVIKSLIKECKFCGKKFHPHKRKNIFCSIKCSAKLNPPPIRYRKDREIKYWMKKEWLIKNYHKKNISISKLAKKINETDKLLSIWLDIHGIKKKTRSVLQCKEKNPFFNKKHSPENIKKMIGPRIYLRGENNHNWGGGKIGFYGTNYKEQKEKALKRDKNTCRICGATKNFSAKKMDVHHIIPFKIIGVDNYKKANKLNNLICLCSKCHTSLEYKTKKILCKKKKSNYCFTEIRQLIAEQASQL